MTKFKNTVAGKILRGLAIGGAAIGGAALIGVTGGAAAPGVGLLGKAALGAGKILKGAKKGAAAIGKTAVSLVTGTTKAEREQIGVIKGEAKAEQDKLEQVERLVKAGASYARANLMVGITASELGAAQAEERQLSQDEKIAAEETGTTKTPVADITKAGGGCLLLMLFLLSGIPYSLTLIFLII